MTLALKLPSEFTVDIHLGHVSCRGGLAARHSTWSAAAVQRAAGAERTPAQRFWGHSREIPGLEPLKSKDGLLQQGRGCGADDTEQREPRTRAGVAFRCEMFKVLSRDCIKISLVPPQKVANAVTDSFGFFMSLFKDSKVGPEYL